MTGLSNLFCAVRRRRDEVQLSSMLAYILHHEDALRVLERIARVPPSHNAPMIEVERTLEDGRCDIAVECPEYTIFIENKVDAGFGPRQIEKYVRGLPYGNPGRVVAITPLLHQQMVDGHDASDGDPVVFTTWSQLAHGLRVAAG